MKMNLISYLRYRANEGKSTEWNYRFQLWLVKNREIQPLNKTLDMWIDLWNDFRAEVIVDHSPINLTPARR